VKVSEKKESDIEKGRRTRVFGARIAVRGNEGTGLEVKKEEEE